MLEKIGITLLTTGFLIAFLILGLAMALGFDPTIALGGAGIMFGGMGCLAVDMLASVWSEE